MIKTKKTNHHPLDERLAVLIQVSDKETITIKEVLQTLGGKGKEILLIFLSLPFCLPIQIPGLAIPFGIISAMIGLGLAFRRHKILLPKFLQSKSLKGKTIKKIAKKGLWLTKKMKKWVHPRLKVMCRHHLISMLNGIIIFILGILLALPLPVPLTNLVAAWGILLMSLGMLEDDGLFVSIGYGIALGCIIFFFFIFFSLNLLYP